MRNQADLIADQRAGLITETEAAYAMSLVENETYKRNGIAKHRWITAQDERTCVECMGNEEAGAIKIDENFPSGVMAPPAHVRCRCYHLPVLPTMIEQKIWTGN
jgi:SPP1 gp7 family putative phage head morphogenesis protein